PLPRRLTLLPYTTPFRSVIKGLPYGERNEYRAGVPPGAPALGEPLPQFLPYLTQRSSAHFSNIKSQGRVIGKTILAVSRPNKKRSEEHTSELQSLTNIVC